MLYIKCIIYFQIILLFYPFIMCAGELSVEFVKVPTNEMPTGANYGIQFDSRNAFINANASMYYITNDYGFNWYKIKVNDGQSSTNIMKHYDFCYLNNGNGLLKYAGVVYKILSDNSTELNAVNSDLRLVKNNAKNISLYMRSKQGLYVELIGDNSPECNIYRTTDAGISWKIITTANLPFNRVTSFDFLSKETIFGSVYFMDTNRNSNYYFVKSTDGGKTWIKICNTDDIGQNGFLINFIYCLNDSIIFVSSLRDDGLYQTMDGGYNWKEINIPEAERTISGVFFLDKNHGRIVGGSTGHIYETNDGGVRWNIISDKEVVSQNFTEYFAGFSLDRWNDLAIARTMLFGQNAKK